MNKTVILVGCRDSNAAFNRMIYTVDMLRLKLIKHIRVRHIHTMFSFETDNCAVLFGHYNSDLTGLRVDAVFGGGYFRWDLDMYLNPNAKNIPDGEMDPVNYICEIERTCSAREAYEKACAEYDKQIERIAKLVDIPDPEWKPTPVSDIIKEIIDRRCPSESKRVAELSMAFADGFEAGVKSVETRTCTRSDSDLATAIGKAIHEEARKAINLEIMKFGVNKNKTILTPEAVREVFKKATDNGVLKSKTDLSKMDGVSLDQYILEPKIIPYSVSGITIHGLAGDYTYKLDKDDMEIKKMDIDEWSKTNPYLTQQQIYLSLGRRNGKTALQNAFIEYYDYLKRTDTPISQELKKCAEEYCRKDVEMTSLLYKNFNMPKNTPTLPEIKNVIFNDPATIVQWADGTKTVVQCQDGDIYDPEKGLAMAISKKILGNKHDYYHTFKHWLKRVNKEDK